MGKWRELILINSNAGRLVISATINPGEAEPRTRRVLESAIESKLSNTTAPDIRVMSGTPTKTRHLLPPAKMYDNRFRSVRSGFWATGTTISPVRARRGKQI